MNYLRHFILLTSMTAVLIVSRHWGQSPGVVVSFGLYGALHSAILVLSLREQPPLWRRLSFIAATAAISMVSVQAAFSGSHFLRVLPGMGVPALLLTVSAALGAAGYGLLVRSFWSVDLSLPAIGCIALCCVLATLAALMAEIFLRAADAAWFAVAWWWAFSAATGYYDAGIGRSEVDHVRHA